LREPQNAPLDSLGKRCNTIFIEVLAVPFTDKIDRKQIVVADAEKLKKSAT